MNDVIRSSTPSWSRRFLAATIATECIALGVFIYAGRQADAAMDKSGVGNVTAWRRWSALAGVSFYSFVLLWMLGVVIAAIAWLVASRRSASSAYLPARVAAYMLLVPPVVFACGWLAVVL